MPASLPRYRALDLFRGATLAAMILVNNPGSWSHVYAPLLHASWHGLTPTDLIFPFFLFIVGSALWFARRSLTALSTAARTQKILRRTLLLFVIGLTLNAYPFVGALEDLRYFGVLQRIALCYGAAAVICFLPELGRYVVYACLLFFYSVLFCFFPDAYSLEHNPVRLLDMQIFGAAHLYQGTGAAFDPEGLLSTLPAIVTTMAGFEVTQALMQKKEESKKRRDLCAAGVVLIAAGYALAMLIPINKQLWTASYTLASAGFAILMLMLMVFAEPQAWFKPVARFFEPFGLNPLFIYVLSWVWMVMYWYIPVGDVSLYTAFFQSLDAFLPAKLASLVFALGHVMLFWFIALWMQRKQIVIKL